MLTEMRDMASEMADQAVRNLIHAATAYVRLYHDCKQPPNVNPPVNLRSGVGAGINEHALEILDHARCWFDESGYRMPSDVVRMLHKKLEDDQP